MKQRTSFLCAAAFAAALHGCGRDEVWDATADSVPTHALADAAVLVDASASRALVLQVDADLTLARTSLPIGHGYAASAATPDRTALCVLSRGDVPRRKAPFDQLPQLAVLTAGDKPAVKETFRLTDPLSGLEMDPLGHFAVVYPGEGDTGFVANPNELSIVDLDAKASETNPLPLTLRSFGGRPQAFFFSEPLGIVGKDRRLLTVLTDRDLGIIDLSAPDLGDITVPLSSTGTRVTPVQIVASDGEPGVDDARLAVRLGSDSNVILIDLPAVPQGESAAHDFRPTPNIVFAGGTTTDIRFVTTDGGLRLAALVPALKAMALVDPSTGVTSQVDLGASFEHMSLVTDVVGATASGADVALLWSASQSQIALVALGSTVGKPYKSVELITLEDSVSQVLDVPSPNQRLKVLVGANGVTFYVLDLVDRTVSPLISSDGTPHLTLSPDGLRAWVFVSGADSVASLDLASLHPKNLELLSPVTGTIDVTRRGGGHALVALRAAQNVDVTVIDAEHPSVDTAVDYPSVLLGDLP